MVIKSVFHQKHAGTCTLIWHLKLVYFTLTACSVFTKSFVYLQIRMPNSSAMDSTWILNTFWFPGVVCSPVFYNLDHITHVLVTRAAHLASVYCRNCPQTQTDVTQSSFYIQNNVGSEHVMCRTMALSELRCCQQDARLKIHNRKNKLY